MNAVERWVKTCRQAYPETKLTDEGHLPLSEEKRLLRRLTEWKARLEETRLAIEAGDKEVPGVRGIRKKTYEATPMTDGERQATWELYCALSPLVARSAVAAYQSADRAERGKELALDMESALAESLEVFRFALSFYEPELMTLGGYVSSILTEYLRRAYRKHLRPEQDAYTEQPMTQSAGASVQPSEEDATIESIARAVIQDDSELQALWEELVAQRSS